MHDEEVHACTLFNYIIEEKEVWIYIYISSLIYNLSILFYMWVANFKCTFYAYKCGHVIHMLFTQCNRYTNPTNRITHLIAVSDKKTRADVLLATAQPENI